MRRALLPGGCCFECHGRYFASPGAELSYRAAVQTRSAPWAKRSARPTVTSPKIWYLSQAGFRVETNRSPKNRPPLSRMNRAVKDARPGRCRPVRAFDTGLLRGYRSGQGVLGRPGKAQGPRMIGTSLLRPTAWRAPGSGAPGTSCASGLPLMARPRGAGVVRCLVDAGDCRSRRRLTGRAKEARKRTSPAMCREPAQPSTFSCTRSQPCCFASSAAASELSRSAAGMNHAQALVVGLSCRWEQRGELLAAHLGRDGKEAVGGRCPVTCPPACPARVIAPSHRVSSRGREEGNGGLGGQVLAARTPATLPPGVRIRPAGGAARAVPGRARVCRRGNPSGR